MPVKNKRGRLWSYGSNTAVSSLFFLGILVFVALIAERHPWRADLTESGAFTLSEQTRNILKSLDQPVEIKAFYPTAAEESLGAGNLLETYRYNSKMIQYEFIDPDRQPDVARRYEIRTYGTLVLEGYGKQQTVQNADEESITNALLKLTSKEQKKIYFLTGHGERPADPGEKTAYSSARSALEKENYSLADLSLMLDKEVPRDASLVIVAGPQKPLLDEEVARLKDYLDGGGKLMVLLDPYQDGGLRDFLKARGVELRDDVVIDESVGLFGGDYLMPVVMQYGTHKMTENFRIPTFYSEARTVEPLRELPKGIAVETLFSTSQNAWGETNLDLLAQGKAGFDEKEDMAGPVPLAVLAEIDVEGLKADQQTEPLKTEPEGESRKQEKSSGEKGYLLVCGDSDFASNTFFGLSGNGDLFLNMVSFMAAEENLITIESRVKGGRPLLLTQGQFWTMVWLVLVIVPLLVVFAGLTVYRVRRSQR